MLAVQKAVRSLFLSLVEYSYRAPYSNFTLRLKLAGFYEPDSSPPTTLGAIALSTV